MYPSEGFIQKHFPEVSNGKASEDFPIILSIFNPLQSQDVVKKFVLPFPLRNHKEMAL